jgi:hypothetical protein
MNDYLNYNSNNNSFLISQFTDTQYSICSSKNKLECELTESEEISLQAELYSLETIIDGFEISEDYSQSFDLIANIILNAASLTYSYDIWADLFKDKYYIMVEYISTILNLDKSEITPQEFSEFMKSETTFRFGRLFKSSSQNLIRLDFFCYLCIKLVDRVNTGLTYRLNENYVPVNFSSKTSSLSELERRGKDSHFTRTQKEIIRDYISRKYLAGWKIGDNKILAYELIQILEIDIHEVERLQRFIETQKPRLISNPNQILLIPNLYEISKNKYNSVQIDTRGKKSVFSNEQKLYMLQVMREKVRISNSRRTIKSLIYEIANELGYEPTDQLAIKQIRNFIMNHRNNLNPNY